MEDSGRDVFKEHEIPDKEWLNEIVQEMQRQGVQRYVVNFTYRGTGLRTGLLVELLE
jgi:hypothetical protein